MARQAGTLPDDEFVEQTRAALDKWQRFYFAYLAIAILFFGLILFFGFSMYGNIVSYATTLDAADTGNLPAAELAEITTASNFYLGVAAGAGLGAGMAMSIFLLLTALKIRQDFRKSSLLVKYHDQVKGQANNQ